MILENMKRSDQFLECFSCFFARSIKIMSSFHSRDFSVIVKRSEKARLPSNVDDLRRRVGIGNNGANFLCSAALLIEGVCRL